jgi:hypothetical protein
MGAFFLLKWFTAASAFVLVLSVCFIILVIGH